MDGNYTESLTDSPKSSSTSDSRYRSNSSTLENIKSVVADKLHTAAGAIQEKVNQVGDPNATVVRYGRQCSEWLDCTADYVRDLSLAQLNKDVQNQVRRNPGRSLLIAGAIGLCLGAWLRRR